MHFLLSFFPYFFHGAFAPSFIWSRRPCRPLRSIGFTLKESTRYTIYSIMSITLQRYLSDSETQSITHSTFSIHFYNAGAPTFGGAKPPSQAPPPANSAYGSSATQDHFILVWSLSWHLRFTAFICGFGLLVLVSKDGLEQDK